MKGECNSESSLLVLLHGEHSKGLLDSGCCKVRWTQPTSIERRRTRNRSWNEVSFFHFDSVHLGEKSKSSIYTNACPFSFTSFPFYSFSQQLLRSHGPAPESSPPPPSPSNQRLHTRSKHTAYLGWFVSRACARPAICSTPRALRAMRMSTARLLWRESRWSLRAELRGRVTPSAFPMV